jgi:hypothetical protein
MCAQLLLPRRGCAALACTACTTQPPIAAMQASTHPRARSHPCTRASTRARVHPLICACIRSCAIRHARMQAGRGLTLLNSTGYQKFFSASSASRLLLRFLPRAACQTVSTQAAQGRMSDCEHPGRTGPHARLCGWAGGWAGGCMSDCQQRAWRACRATAGCAAVCCSALTSTSRMLSTRHLLAAAVATWNGPQGARARLRNCNLRPRGRCAVCMIGDGCVQCCTPTPMSVLGGRQWGGWARTCPCGGLRGAALWWRLSRPSRCRWRAPAPALPAAPYKWRVSGATEEAARDSRFVREQQQQ